MKLKLIALAAKLAALATVFTITAPAQAQITLSLSPVSQSIGVGDTTTVDVVVSGLDQILLGGWSAWVNFDPAVVSFNSTTFGTLLSSGAASAQFSTLDPIFGIYAEETANVAANLGVQTGLPSFILGTFSFTGASVGVSDLIFDIPPFVSLSDDDGFSLPFDTVNASITVTDGTQRVPDSGVTLPLILVLGVLGWIKRSRAN